MPTMVCTSLRELPETEAVATTFRPAQQPKLKKVLKGIYFQMLQTIIFPTFFL